MMVFALFLLMAGSQEPSTIDSLSRLDIDQSILATISKAFVRYYLMLIPAIFCSTIYLLIDLKQTGELGHPEAKSANGIIARSVIFGLLLAYIVLVGVLQFPLCGDDSYIDFRYVKNWLTGVGLDYNAGERVLGFTSHLHVLLLTVLAFCFKTDNIPVVSQMTNVVLQMINVLLLSNFLRGLKSSANLALIGAAVYGLDPYNVQQIIFGKESHMVAMLIIISLWSIQLERYHLLAWAATLTPFVRPEGIIWYGLCLAFNLKKASLKRWLAPAIAAGGFLSLLYVLFGTVIPHGMIGKFSMFYPMPQGSMLGKSMWMVGSGFLVPRLTINDPGLYGLVAILTGVIATVLLVIFVRKLPLGLYTISIVIFLLVFTIKNPAAFPWYLCWFSLVPTVLAIEVFDRLLKAEDKRTTRQKLVLTMASVYFMTVLIIQQPVRSTSDLTAITFAWTSEYHRLQQFQKALDCLDEIPGGRRTTIATPEIGFIGYHHQGKILDLCGLVSPEVVRFGRPDIKRQAPGEAYEINPEVIKSLKPDYVLTLELFGRELFEDADFKNSYEEVCFFPNDWGGGKGVYLFRRMAK